jgi:hypothetical protein
LFDNKEKGERRMEQEKRRFSRIGFNMPAELTVNDQVFSLPQIDNLSIGGCLLKMGVPFEEGLACRLWLPLDPTNTQLAIEVFGEIVRCDAHGVSMRFTRITPESLFHLRNLIRYNAADPDQIEMEINEHPGLL